MKNGSRHRTPIQICKQDLLTVPLNSVCASAGSGGALPAATLSSTPGCGHKAEPSLRVDSIGSQSVPEWIVELVTLHHQACLAVDSEVNEGRTKGKAIEIVARRFNGRRLKSRPGYRVQLSAKTLWRLHDQWKRGGQIPAALYRRYAPASRIIDAPVLVRFVSLAADRPWKSFGEALAVFNARGGAFGSGRRNGRKLQLKADTLRRQLPKGFFRQVQAQFKIISRAQRAIAACKFEAIAEIRARPIPPSLLANATDVVFTNAAGNTFTQNLFGEGVISGYNGVSGSSIGPNYIFGNSYNGQWGNQAGGMFTIDWGAFNAGTTIWDNTTSLIHWGNYSKNVKGDADPYTYDPFQTNNASVVTFSNTLPATPIIYGEVFYLNSNGVHGWAVVASNSGVLQWHTTNLLW